MLIPRELLFDREHKALATTEAREIRGEILTSVKSWKGISFRTERLERALAGLWATIDALPPRFKFADRNGLAATLRGLDESSKREFIAATLQGVTRELFQRFEFSVLARAELLAEQVIRSLNEGDPLVAGVATRALMELTIFYIDLTGQVEALRGAVPFSRSRLMDPEVQAGLAKWEEEAFLPTKIKSLQEGGLVDAKNILTRIDHVVRTDPEGSGIREAYARLCELSHPNAPSSLAVTSSEEGSPTLRRGRAVPGQSALIMTIFPPLRWSAEWLVATATRLRSLARETAT